MLGLIKKGSQLSYWLRPYNIKLSVHYPDICVIVHQPIVVSSKSHSSLSESSQQSSCDQSERPGQ